MPFLFDTEYYNSLFHTIHNTKIGFSNSQIKSRFDNHDKDGSNEIKTSKMRRPLMKWDLASNNNHPKPQLNSWQIMLNSQYVSHRIHKLFRESQGFNFHGIKENFCCIKWGKEKAVINFMELKLDVYIYEKMHKFRIGNPLFIVFSEFPIPSTVKDGGMGQDF